jgi:Mg2+ and Co2+ transporter CorA
LIFLIAHLQKAALLMIADRLVEALRNLDVQDPENVKRFKRAIRASFEGFLRFTHRYWFHEVAEQALARGLYECTTQHLQTRTLYQEVKTRISDMADYLETDSIRRQANTVVRLTVVTIFGLIGTITTGFLGMNLLAEAEAPLWKRLLFFTGVTAVTTTLTVYTMVKSKKLSDFLDALSDERLSAWEKCRAFAEVWRSGSSA